MGTTATDPRTEQAPPTQEQANTAQHKAADNGKRLLEQVIDATSDEELKKKNQVFDFQQRNAALFAESGLFQDIKGQTPKQSLAQAFVKIALGASMGFSPAESMTGIDIIQGRVGVGANLRAARMQRAGYSWNEMILSDEGCWLPLSLNGRPVLTPVLDANGQIIFNEDGTPQMQQVTVSFTRKDATIAGLIGKDNYKKNPRNMFFARAITNAQRWYAPAVLGIDILSTEEAVDLEPVGLSTSHSMGQIQAPQRASEMQKITPDNFGELLEKEKAAKATVNPEAEPTEEEMKQWDLEAEQATAGAKKK